jgi:NTE family protein
MSRLKKLSLASLCSAVAILLPNFTRPAVADATPSKDDGTVIIKTDAVNSVASKRRPTIALALGGGGIRGSTHIGVLRVLQREGIPIDYIVGTSMGSVIGSLYAAGVPLDEIEKMLMTKKLQKAYQPRPLMAQVMCQPAKMLAHVVTGRPCAGLYTGKTMEKFFEKRLPVGKKNIEDTNIKFAAVVTDFTTGELKTLDKGPITQAVRASSSIPLLMRPAEIDGHLYVDGSLRVSVPSEVAAATGADIVIGIQTDEPLTEKQSKTFRSYVPVFDQMINIVMTELGQKDRKAADMTIWPDLRGIRMYQTSPKLVHKAVAAGELAATQALPNIRKLLSSKIASKESSSITESTAQ